MLKKCVESWKEYGILITESYKWILRHWKGFLMANIVLLGLEYEYFTGFEDVKKITKAHGIKSMKWGVREKEENEEES